MKYFAVPNFPEFAIAKLCFATVSYFKVVKVTAPSYDQPSAFSIE